MTGIENLSWHRPDIDTTACRTYLRRSVDYAKTARTLNLMDGGNYPEVRKNIALMYETAALRMLDWARDEVVERAVLVDCEDDLTEDHCEHLRRSMRHDAECEAEDRLTTVRLWLKRKSKELQEEALGSVFREVRRLERLWDYREARKNGAWEGGSGLSVEDLIGTV